LRAESTAAGARLVPPTRLTWGAVVLGGAVVASSAVFLLMQYGSLPDILPVQFNAAHRPNGWQYKTYPRVLMPVLVQGLLVAVFGAIAALLLSRPHRPGEERSADMTAAAIAAEAVALVALVWVAFQGYAAVALAGMWQRGFGGLGHLYGTAMWVGIAMSALVFMRAQRGLGRPEPRPFEPAHWWLGHLYKNAGDPALFVPTRDGRRWTLNFGRPVAVALMGTILAIGILGPTIVLGLLLRS
jgi:uncharacterized membrane protein